MHKANPVKRRAIPEILLFLVILVSGALFVRFTWINFKDDKSDQVLHIARSVVAALPKGDLEALDAKPGDIDKPQYQHLKNILKAIIRVNTKARFAYIYTEQNGKLYFFVDSEPADSKDCSPPGQEYSEADNVYRQPFKTGKDIVTNPVTDRWGTWITVLIPVKDEVTGKTTAVFAMDFDAKAWDKSLLFEVIQSSALMWLLLLTILFLLRIKVKNQSLKKEITERKRAEEAIILAENTYRNIFLNSQIGLFKSDMHTGLILDANDALARLIGYRDSASLLAEPINIAEHYTNPADRDKILALLQAHGEFQNFEAQFRRNDGSIIWMRYSARLVREKGWIEGVSEDITQSKQAEDLLREALVKAEAGNRLKSAFIYNISHEVRTPLNGILGFSQLITQPDISDQEKEQFYLLIKASSNRLINTITNYMDISLIGSENIEVNRKPFDLHDMLHKLFEQFQPVCAAKHLNLHLKISEKINRITLHSDAELLQKSISHLLDNAVKFTLQGEITFGYEIKPGLLEFFVKDTGIGISQESQTRVFDNFVQEELSITRRHEGSGLGLSIVQGLARLLGGEIRVESEKGKGSTFFLQMPYDNGWKETAIPELAEEKVAVLNSQVVLIAEDDESNRFYLEKILKTGSVRVFLAKDGKEAVEQCRTHPEISLVFMDLKMPVMDGYEATRAIRSFRKDLPIIALTAFAMSGDKKRALEAGCDDYLSKPVSREVLLDKLKKSGVKI